MAATPEFKGFSEDDVQVGRINMRLWKIEEENVKIREEMRDLMAAVRGWKGEKEAGSSDMIDILEEMKDMKKRESQREKENKKLREEVEKIVALNKKYSDEIQELRKENENLRKMVEKKGVKVDSGVMRTEVKELVEKEVKSFREIMDQQEKEKVEIPKGEVVKILQQNEDMVRNIAEKKKCVIVSGLKEEEIRNWQERKKKEDESIKSLLAKITGDGEDLTGEVEESVRLGQFEKGKNRPVKI